MKIDLDDFIPKQQLDDASKIKINSKSYFQKFIKFPEIGIFHSYAELLHAALLEFDPDVISFVPQPFKFKINGKPYIPDCYVAYKNKKEVVELKPDGEFDQDRQLPLTAFLDDEHGIDFKVVSNESMFELETKAKNCLFIIRTLCNVQDVLTRNQEAELLERFTLKPNQCIGDVVQIGNRINAGLNEIALFRLIRKGKLSITHNQQIDLNTEVSRCNK